MSYQSHNLQQGSDAWHQFRAAHFGASEASAMLGMSKYTTRSELMRQKATGISKDADAGTQSIFNRGHETEALARPIIEAQIGEQLSPIVCSLGNLSCSCDGLTFDDSLAWEHKQDSNALFSAVAAGQMPEEHLPQCQQILMITGASKLIFTVSNGTPERMASLEVYPDQTWFERIKSGWVQFHRDLENYQHIEHAEKPKAEAILNLPALSVQATGMVTYSNLPEFKAAAETYIASINTDLQTDQQFSDAEATVKFCKSTEDTLEVTKKAILAQTATIDEVIRTVDYIQAQLRDKRLMLDKLVKSEKEARKLAIVNKAREEFNAHFVALEGEIKPIRLIAQHPDFGGAIKGLKSLASIQDAVSTALAQGKIDSDAVAKDIRVKLAWYKEHAAEMSFLLADLQQIISKPMDDFTLTITSRIEAHQKAEAEKMEAVRLSIQAEEEAKARAMVEEDQRAKPQVSESERANTVAQDQVAERQSSPPKSSNVVVIEHQDAIGAFLSSRDFGKDVGKIRAILVEFVKFEAQYNCKKVA